MGYMELSCEGGVCREENIREKNKRCCYRTWVLLCGPGYTFMHICIFLMYVCRCIYEQCTFKVVAVVMPEYDVPLKT